ncbi:hypothetical protein VB796_08710 [Arcicella sp. LKC2W]|uniref:hypothetical protein n=1 Tax=Arcicella sp. LKC2W TaxID=2984198 RepID=UPI002B2142EB|nr:hypothetical protein [Arcicella sp. LKC2W]MEA5459115.1 hypothetical protein [Arcicella sp. LKC2W]
MTNEQRAEVENFAGLFTFTKAQICQITGVDINDSELDDAIIKGELLSKARVMQSKISLAQSGSSEAQKQVEKLIKQKQKKRF